ncbi:alpha-E domain-containing protein [Donghicola tyrosinivorans]|uniref:Putative alpha-E superfamily protein n=1 Tax=Donghicola tyrosinivorans TaxID=1652492 RepID=A0A2T0WFF6_9RHOB|nr:alpha-E domain-containing protein [Donghicola tyrosinivorans]PRY85395.1 putative alpha-E superfamily protein [Donghicola tyrosinivorans]
MLSRTAQGLYWMSRYVERAENVARLLDAGRRMEGLPGSDDFAHSEWASIIIAAGCEETFGEDKLEKADRETVTHHLAFDRENPSSIFSCIEAARENARAMRGAITKEVWTAINSTWSEARSKSMEDMAEGKYADFIDWVLAFSFHFRGAVNGTLLRDERLAFINLGKNIERADATARLLDVKYNVLLPRADEVGQGLDLMQWQQILRASNALLAFRHIYHEATTPPRVVDLLVLNRQFPRSLRFSYEAICNDLRDVGLFTRAQRNGLAKAERLLNDMSQLSALEIIDKGLHEWLTEMIVETNQLGIELADAYGFFEPVKADTPEPDELEGTASNSEQLQHQN